jgi:hypothetical protein
LPLESASRNSPVNLLTLSGLQTRPGGLQNRARNKRFFTALSLGSNLMEPVRCRYFFDIKNGHRLAVITHDGVEVGHVMIEKG